MWMSMVNLYPWVRQIQIQIQIQKYENYVDVNGEPVSVGETRSNLPLLASSTAALKNKHNVDDRGDDGNDGILANHGDNDLND